MFSIDCGSCPARPDVCDGCILSVLDGGNVQVDELSPESCGYVLDPEVRDAIDVLRGLGMVSAIEILDVEAAA
ncbi:hypothetical protein [Dietzia sp. ANT_WB102]|uniref:hypothetical protein n=1 Tax=Dietzia sp. ANT_WB102 TaxID=2597345 RepID=UPI0011EDDD25|nr:hypothetical protein [Dietzia sp. ANT_WB102]KAA0917239.1 hypothetical protein FQ137_13660 [Dietzia sp. ANT_WB102]